MPLKSLAIVAVALCVIILVVIWMIGGWSLGGDSARSVWSDAITWMFTQQRILHRQLVGALRTLSESGGGAAAWALISVSFIYGVFHAAGPGHGKAVLTAYLITHPEHVKRGVGLAMASALCQGLVAIVLVYGLMFVADWQPRETAQAVSWSERLSFVLVFLMGGYLVVRAVRSGLTRGHSVHGMDCGHSHGPNPEHIADASDLKATLGVILSIGLRPCTGAVLVLVFAQVLQLAWAGVAAVVAMSFGAALTVVALAFVATNVRARAGRAMALRGMAWQVLLDAIAVAGGVVLMTIGYSLLASSFSVRHFPGL